METQEVQAQARVVASFGVELLDLFPVGNSLRHSHAHVGHSAVSVPVLLWLWLHGRDEPGASVKWTRLGFILATRSQNARRTVALSQYLRILRQIISSKIYLNVP